MILSCKNKSKKPNPAKPCPPQKRNQHQKTPNKINSPQMQHIDQGNFLKLSGCCASVFDHLMALPAAFCRETVRSQCALPLKPNYPYVFPTGSLFPNPPLCPACLPFFLFFPYHLPAFSHFLVLFFTGVNLDWFNFVFLYFFCIVSFSKIQSGNWKTFICYTRELMGWKETQFCSVTSANHRWALSLENIVEYCRER